MNVYVQTTDIAGNLISILYQTVSTATEARAIMADLIKAGVEGITVTLIPGV